MSNTQSDAESLGITEAELDQAVNDATTGNDLFNAFVGKMQSKLGQQIEDQSIELFTKQQHAGQGKTVEAAAEFLAAARTNCLLITQLMLHLQKAGTPVSFTACNLFFMELNRTTYDAIMSVGDDDSVH